MSPEAFRQIGNLTRLLHVTLEQPGVMPKLQIATEGVPDARRRLWGEVDDLLASLGL